MVLRCVALRVCVVLPDESVAPCVLHGMEISKDEVTHVAKVPEETPGGGVACMLWDMWYV